jgi:hypothetical protein
MFPQFLLHQQETPITESVSNLTANHSLFSREFCPTTKGIAKTAKTPEARGMRRCPVVATLRNQHKTTKNERKKRLACQNVQRLLPRLTHTISTISKGEPYEIAPIPLNPLHRS